MRGSEGQKREGHVSTYSRVDIKRHASFAHGHTHVHLRDDVAGCVGEGVGGYVGVWVCGCVGVWVCGSMGARLHVAMSPYACVCVVNGLWVG